jgi:hypothetical protein
MLINSPNISGSLTVTGNSVISGSLTVVGGINATITGSATSASYVEYSNVANKPTLVSGSSQITYSGLSDIPSGIVSGSSQITYSGISSIPSGIVSGSSQVSFNGITDKPTLVSGSSQITYSGISGIPSGIVSGSSQVAALGFATTSSNTFRADQVITGSLFISQNLVVAGSSSIQYISSSVVNIADNIITVNAFNPGVRFGGLAVIDSGSSPQISGSMLFDSIKDQWIFVHETPGTVTSSVLLMGPETYNDLGNETYLSANRLPKGSGIEHLRDSNITDTGTNVSINSNSTVTGSFTVITGSAVELQVTNTGVRLGNAFTDTHTVTGSFSASGSVNLTPSVVVTGDGSNDIFKAVRSGTTRVVIKNGVNTLGINTDTVNNPLTVNGGADFNGNVGIGYTSPSYRLSVSGSSNSGIFVKQGSQIGDSPSGSNFYSALTFENTSTTNAWSIGYSQGAKFSINYFDAGSTYTRVLTANASGNVGVGTINPDARLHISDATSLTRLIVDNTANAALGAGIYMRTYSSGTLVSNATIRTDNAGNFAIFTGTTSEGERMRITSGGNVGIGVTPSAWGSTTALQIGARTSLANITGDTHLTNNAFYNGTNWIYLESATAANYYQSAGVHVWRTVGSGTAGGTISWTEVMRITTGGNVGIGTSPSFTLDVNGNTRAERYRGINSLTLNTYTTVNPASNVFLYSQPNDRDAWIFLDSADTSSNWGIYHRQIDSTVSNLPGNSLGFIGGGANTLQSYISLDNGNAYFRGNVGIGTPSPLLTASDRGNLTINGSATSILTFGIAGAYSGYIFSTGTVLELDAQGARNIQFNTNGQERMRLTSGGSLQIGTSSGSGAKTFIYDNRSNSSAIDESALYIRQDGSNPIQTWAGGGANERMRITSGGLVGINTNSPTSRLSVCSTTACSTVVNVQGCAGQLFSVTDNLVGDIFSVSDISGIPILNVNSNGTVCVDSKIAVGANHTVSGAYASVTGGRSNTASGTCSTVSGGYLNTASGDYGGTVGGGGCNRSTCMASTVAGGFSNLASGANSAIGGGRNNCAINSEATVSGGRGNRACGFQSAIGGGGFNTASGYYSAILGGVNNTAACACSAAATNGQTTSSTCQFRVNALSKASGTFRIDHPDPSKKYTHYLSHSFVESPTAGDNIYRYKVNVVNGQATITLPSYYKYLNQNDQIWVTPQGHFGVGYGEVNAEQTQVTIYGNADGEYNVLLIGTRKDHDATHHWQGVETYK